MSYRKKITYSARPSYAARSAHAKGSREFRTYDTSHIRPKKSIIPIIFAVVLAAAVLGLLAWGGSIFLNSCSQANEYGSLPAGEQVDIVIAEGSGAKTIGTQLQEAGVIANANAFVSRVQELGLDSSLQPGTYTFSGGLTLDEAIDVLKEGPSGFAGDSFTIPEGFTLQQTADRVAETYEGTITAEDFLACALNAEAYAADYPFVAGAYNNSLEGFLFPKTYPKTAGATADTIVRQMLSQYQTETAGLDYSYAESQGLSPYDVLILASIIEREAAADNRATVSSVFYNRMAADMPLQSDATSAYAVGRDPTPEDLQVEGPYNTYLNMGLPAGPICSPGVESMQAACSPEETGYYYFYFKEVDGTMQYYFSETYEEHNDAIFS